MFYLVQDQAQAIRQVYICL